MENQKLHRVMAISQEVAEFHPLLQRLLPKLPGVIRTEYTHGSQEHGADFVIERNDLTIDVKVYCGLVVKCGNINKPETQRIIDQVRECHGERHFLAGKHKIFLSDVWIVTNGVIGASAQGLIYQEFAASKIQFIDREILIKLIDKHLSSYWTDVDIHVGDYLSTLKLLTEAEDKELSLVPLDTSFYIKQELVRIKAGTFTRQQRKLPKRENTDICDELKSNQFILVEAEAGLGKSKFARELIKHYCDSKIYNAEHLVPIWLHAKQFFTEFEGSFANLLEHRLNDYREILNDKGNTFLVILDGLDELKQKADIANEQIKTISTQLKANQNLRCVLLSRSLSSEFGQSLNTENATRLELLPLSLNKTIDFIKKLCSDISPANRIFEDLKHSSLFKQLPKSPIAAILLARLLKEKQTELPSTLPELYSKYVELALGRWDVNRGLQSDAEYEVLDTVLMMISEHLMENQLDGLTRDEALSFFTKYLEPRNIPDVNPTMMFELAMRRCPMVRASQSDSRFSFKHRTFAEFLYAKKVSELGFAKLNSKALEPYWSNSLYFYIGLRKDCSEVLEKIIDLRAEHEYQEWYKIMQLADYLLAGYKTPYKVITSGVKYAALANANLFLNISKGTSKIVLDVFPEIQVLYVFEYLFKTRYGYPFLKAAIDNAVEEIFLGNEAHEVKAYAVFFLGMAKTNILGQMDFDFVLNDYLKPLPLPIDIMLTCHSRDLKNKGKNIKRHEKKVFDHLKSNPKLQNTVKELFERPISKVLATRVKDKK